MHWMPQPAPRRQRLPCLPFMERAMRWFPSVRTFTISVPKTARELGRSSAVPLGQTRCARQGRPRGSGPNAEAVMESATPPCSTLTCTDCSSNGSQTDMTKTGMCAWIRTDLPCLRDVHPVPTLAIELDVREPELGPTAERPRPSILRDSRRRLSPSILGLFPAPSMPRRGR